MSFTKYMVIHLTALKTVCLLITSLSAPTCVPGHAFFCGVHTRVRVKVNYISKIKLPESEG